MTKISILENGSKNIESYFLSYCFRRNILHKEKEHLANDYEKNVKLLKTKYDSDINLLKQEHALSASKVLYVWVTTFHECSAVDSDGAANCFLLKLAPFTFCS